MALAETLENAGFTVDEAVLAAQMEAAKQKIDACAELFRALSRLGGLTARKPAAGAPENVQTMPFVPSFPQRDGEIPGGAYETRQNPELLPLADTSRTLPDAPGAAMVPEGLEGAIQSKISDIQTPENILRADQVQHFRNASDSFYREDLAGTSGAETASVRHFEAERNIPAGTEDNLPLPLAVLSAAYAKVRRQQQNLRQQGRRFQPLIARPVPASAGRSTQSPDVLTVPEFTAFPEATVPPADYWHPTGSATAPSVRTGAPETTFPPSDALVGPAGNTPGEGYEVAFARAVSGWSNMIFPL